MELRIRNSHPHELGDYIMTIVTEYEGVILNLYLSKRQVNELAKQFKEAGF
jgi:hypothetical protein